MGSIGLTKTTVEIADDLLRQAKKLALESSTTLRDLIERGLRREINEHRRQTFELGDESYGGSGTQRGVEEGDWSAVSAIIYEGRGG